MNSKNIKDIILGLILAVSIPTFAQESTPTVRETQLWIEDILETYYYKESPLPVLIDIEYNNNGEMIITMKTQSSHPVLSSSQTFKIPIKTMKKVKYEYTNDYVVITLRSVSKEGKPLISSILSNRLSFLHYEQITLLMSKNFEKEDLPNRFTNAMNHLIELHGGEVVKDVF